MNDRVKNTFDKIHAEDALKEHTKEFLYQKTKGYRKKGVGLTKSNLRIPAVLCLVLLLIGFSGYEIYFTPTSAVSIDINPSLELGINRFDRVISVTGYNSDGEELASSLDIKFMNYNDALDSILENQQISELLSENEPLSITVVGSNEEQSSQILADAQISTAETQNIYCHEGNSHEVEAAHEAGMSFGKYQAFLKLQELDPSITAEEAENLTMREIHQRIHQLSGDEERSSEQKSSFRHQHHGKH